MDVRYINTEIDPRDDFYGFAAGRWSEYNEQPADEPAWSNFEVVEERVTERLRDMLKSLDESDAMQRKIATYQRIYTNYERRNREGISPLVPYLEKVVQMNDKMKLMEWYTRTFCDDLFCSLNISQDLIDSTKYEIWLEQSLDLGNRDYYLSQTAENVGIRQKYRQVNVDLLEMSGLFTRENAEKLFDVYFTIETEIARLAYSPEKLQKPEENYNRMTLAELSELIGMDARTLLSWSDYNETESVIVAQPEPVKRAFELINCMSLQHLKDVIEYRIVTEYSGWCSESFSEKAWEFTQYMTGAKERTPKWKREVHHMTSSFYEPIGKIYSERYFSPEAKERVLSMTHNMVDAYREIMREQTWMSEETREKAIEKLDAMQYVKIGYPDKWDDYSDVPVDETKSYVENNILFGQWSHRRSIEKYYNKTVDRSEWPMMPQTVNACCMQQQNEICFPAAILQIPFFDADADDASNYGAIGVVIAHEMTHNFDMAGRLFSKTGDMLDWWSDGDTEKFKELTENTKERFDNMIALPFVKCNGELTLNENIADYGGLKIAYRALEKVMDGRIDITEPITGYNWKQRFFISYAQMWASVISDECLKRQVTNDPHSVPSVRTNGTLPMFTPWYEAWDVRLEDKLYIDEEKRAKVW